MNLAYIDAGTGSAIMAALAGGAAGLWVYVKTSVRTKFGRKSSPKADESGTTKGALTDVG